MDIPASNVFSYHGKLSCVTLPTSTNHISGRHAERHITWTPLYASSLQHFLLTAEKKKYSRPPAPSLGFGLGDFCLLLGAIRRKQFASPPFRNMPLLSVLLGIQTSPFIAHGELWSGKQFPPCFYRDTRDLRVSFIHEEVALGARVKLLGRELPPRHVLGYHNSYHVLPL